MNSEPCTCSYCENLSLLDQYTADLPTESQEFFKNVSRDLAEVEMELIDVEAVVKCNTDFRTKNDLIDILAKYWPDYSYPKLPEHNKYDFFKIEDWMLNNLADILEVMVATGNFRNDNSVFGS